MVMKLKKKKKSVRQRGETRHGWGARKKHKGRGHRGGTGMAGTGKGADHKKSLIINKYGNKYFGKQGITSKGTEKKRVKRVNLRDIERHPEKFKVGKDGWLDLKDYKILGDGKLSKKIKIKALDISKKAKEIIEKAGGEVEVLRKEKVEKELVKEEKKETGKLTQEEPEQVSEEENKPVEIAKDTKIKTEEVKEKKPEVE